MPSPILTNPSQKMLEAPLDQPILVLDASGPSAFAGIAASGSAKWITQGTTNAQAVEELFPLLQRILKEAKVSPVAINQFIYCAGPGAQLGLRAVAMMLNTWLTLPRSSESPPSCIAYDAIALTAANLRQDTGHAIDVFHIIADWRRGLWHHLTVENGKIGKTASIESGRVSSLQGPVYHLPQRKDWEAPPVGVMPVTYQPNRVLECLRDAPDVFWSTAQAELVSVGNSEYQKWQPIPHGN